LGIPNLLSRFVPEYFTQSKYRLIAKLFTAANLLQTAFAALLLALAFIFAPVLTGWVKFPNAETALRVFAIGAFAYLLAENYRVLLSGLFMHRAIFWRTLIYNIVRLAAIFFAARQPDPFMMVVIAEVCLYGLSLLLYYLAYRRMVQPKVEADTHPPEQPPWKRFVRYSGLSYINEVGVMLLNSATDLFLVSGLLGGAAVGLYALASRILSILNNALPSNFLSGVITPLFFSEYGASRENARFGFTLLVKISLLATIPMAVWTALMARPLIVELFDPRYGEAAGLLVVMVVFLPMETLRYPLALLLLNAERNDLLIYSKIFGVFKILVGLWLLPIYGVMAMAWITALAIVGQNILSYVWIVTILKTKTDLVGVGKLLLNGAISAALFFPLASRFHGVFGVLGSIAVYMIIYLAINLVHKTFRPEERDFLNKKLPYPVWKF